MKRGAVFRHVSYEKSAAPILPRRGAAKIKYGTFKYNARDWEVGLDQ
jgi:hypothetical protein